MWNSSNVGFFWLDEMHIAVAVVYDNTRWVFLSI